MFVWFVLKWALNTSCSIQKADNAKLWSTKGEMGSSPSPDWITMYTCITCLVCGYRYRFIYRYRYRLDTVYDPLKFCVSNTWTESVSRIQDFQCLNQQNPCKPDELVTVFEHSHLCKRICFHRSLLLAFTLFLIANCF